MSELESRVATLLEQFAAAEGEAAVLAALGKQSSLKAHVPERPGQVDRHIGSTEKAERLTGWRARTDFETGLERTVAWFRESALVG